MAPRTRPSTSTSSSAGGIGVPGERRGPDGVVGRFSAGPAVERLGAGVTAWRTASAAAAATDAAADAGVSGPASGAWAPAPPTVSARLAPKARARTDLSRERIDALPEHWPGVGSRMRLIHARAPHGEAEKA